jgi:hypothetical protein
MKKLFILISILLLTVGISAQSRWAGFLDPVSTEQIKGLSSDKSKSVTTLIRPQLSVAGMAFKLQYDELGNFDKVASSFVSRAGMGISLSHFKLVNDQPYNDYSFAAMVSIATTENPNAGFMLTASALNLYGLSPNIGIGYDIVRGLPFKQNIFFVWGATVKFD